MFAEDISEDFSEDGRNHFYWILESISGKNFRNLRGRLLSSEKFSEVFTLWVFTLKPFPDRKSEESPICLCSFSYFLGGTYFWTYLLAGHLDCKSHVRPHTSLQHKTRRLFLAVPFFKD